MRLSGVALALMFLTNAVNAQCQNLGTELIRETCNEQLEICYPGEFPYATTFVEFNQTLIVADFTSGLTHIYNVTENQVEFARSITAPINSELPTDFIITSGITWRPRGPGDPTEGLLFWIVNQGGVQRLVRTDLRGDILDPLDQQNEVFSPLGGQVGDLTFDTVRETFWAIDVDNLLIFEFVPRQTEATINLTNRQFFHPGIHPDCVSNPALCPRGGAYGLGLSFIEQRDQFNRQLGFIDVLTGSLIDGKPTGIVRMQIIQDAPAGVEAGWSYTFPTSFGRLGFAQGLATYTEKLTVDDPECAVHLVVFDVDAESGVSSPTIRRFSTQTSLP